MSESIATNPYKGPRPFQTYEAMFGREREILRLREELVSARVHILYGRSGVGKTSLIQAGLIPSLEEEGYQVLPVGRVGLDPPEYLFQQSPAREGTYEPPNRFVLSLMVTLGEADFLSSEPDFAGMQLRGYLSREVRKGETDRFEVLILDQFEELFTVENVSDDERRNFFQQLREALDAMDLWVLISIRDEYFGALVPYLQDVQLSLENPLKLDPLSKEAAAEAIHEPAARAGRTFTSEAIQYLVADLSAVQVEGPDGSTAVIAGAFVEPIILQSACYNLWESLPRDENTVTAEHILQMGGIDFSLTDYYAEQIRLVAERSGTGEGEIRRWVEEALITVRGTRGQVMMGAEETWGLPNDAIDLLQNAYLVRSEARAGAIWIELVHDRLIDAVLSDNEVWFQDLRSELESQARQWEEKSRSEEMLLRGDGLDKALSWAESKPDSISPLEKEFLDESLRRRLKRALSSEDRGVREDAIDELARIGSRWAVDVLFSALETNASGTRLRRFVDSGQEREKADMRRSIVTALGEIGGSRAAEILRGASDDPDEWVSEAARDALRKMDTFGGGQIFISYARQDEDFVRKLVADLRRTSFTVWLEKEELRGGDLWVDAIERAIESSSYFLIVLSPESVASEWVRKELDLALAYEKRVIPILHRRASLPLELKGIQYVGFTGDYDRGYKDLLEAMRFAPPSGEGLPEPPRIWWYIGTGDDDRQVRILERADTVRWGANRSTREGDIVLMYRTSPYSDIAYLFRARSDAQPAEKTPDWPWDFSVELGEKVALKNPVTLVRIREHPDLEDWGLARNVQGVMRRRMGIREEGYWRSLRGLLVGWNPGAAEKLGEWEGLDPALLLEEAWEVAERIADPTQRRLTLEKLAPLLPGKRVEVEPPIAVPRDYLNFDLHLSGEAEALSARVLNSPFGQSSVPLEISIDEEVERFLADHGDLERAREVGRRLFEAVFEGEILSLYKQCLDYIEGEQNGMRIQLRMEDPELHRLPWELMYDASTERFLALSVDTPIVRYFESALADLQLAADLPLRLLVVIARPADLGPLDIEGEGQSIQSAFGPLEDQDLVEVDMLERATAQNLRLQLERDEYHVLHLIGHSGADEDRERGVIYLEDELGWSFAVDVYQFGLMLRNHPSLRLVVVNRSTVEPGGYFGFARDLIQQGLPALVDMQFNISDPAAITFAQVLYASLANGLPLDAAVTEARHRIFVEESDTSWWAAPALYMHLPEGGEIWWEAKGRLASPEWLERLSPSSQRALQWAESLRLATRAPEVYDTLLLSGLYVKKDGPTRRILTLFDDETVVTERLEALIDRSTGAEVHLDELSMAQGIAIPKIPLASEAQFAIQEGVELAGESGSRTVRTRHLLAGLLGQRENIAVAWIADLLQIAPATLHDLIVEALAKPASRLVVAPRDPLNLRSGPAASEQVVQVIQAGEPLTVLGDVEEARERIGRVGEWIQVETLRGEIGYVAASNVVAEADAWLPLNAIRRVSTRFEEGIPALRAEGPVNAICFSPDGRWLVYGDEGNKVRVQSTSDWKMPGETLSGHNLAVEALVFSPDGTWVASGSRDASIAIWNPMDWSTAPIMLRNHELRVWCLKFSPEGRWLASGSNDNTVCIWRVEDWGADPVVLTGHRDGVRALAFSPDGQWLVSGDNGGGLRIWNTDAWEPGPKPLTMHEEQINSLVFSPDGRWLVSASDDTTAQIWDTSQWASTPFVLPPHEGWVRALAFSPEGDWLITGSGDTYVRVWSVPHWGSDPILLSGHEAMITCLAFSPDGRWLASGSNDFTARIWSVQDWGASPITLREHEGLIRSLAFSPDGRWLVSGSEDDTVRVWEIAQVEFLFDTSTAGAEAFVPYGVDLSAEPTTVLSGGQTTVTVTLEPYAVGDGRPVLEIPAGETDLGIFIHVPDGLECIGPDAASIPLEPTASVGISQLRADHQAQFQLLAVGPTSTVSVEVEFLTQSSLREKTAFQLEVQEAELELGLARSLTPPRAVPHPDIVLQVRVHADSTHDRIAFHYYLEGRGVGERGWATFQSGFVPEDIVERVNQNLAVIIAESAGGIPEERRQELRLLGEELAYRILPTGLWEILTARDVHSLLIIAPDDAWLPWEFLHDGLEFLGERLLVARWIKKFRDLRPYEFPVGQIRIVYFAGMEQWNEWSQVIQPTGAPVSLPMEGGILENLETARVIRGLHLLRQGTRPEEVETLLPVLRDHHDDDMQGDGIDEPPDLARSKLNLRSNRPVVSLSFLDAGLPELTNLDGRWAPAFVSAGCSAFVGPMWTVSPSVEAAFLRGFYDGLWRGFSLGEAFLSGRRLARVSVPESSDWMAYILYGDPMARAYRPVKGEGYAVVEPVGWDPEKPVKPGENLRCRLGIRANPPVWHSDRLVEVSEALKFEDLSVRVIAPGLDIEPGGTVRMTKVNEIYLGWVTLSVPDDVAVSDVTAEFYFVEKERMIHMLTLPIALSGIGGHGQ